MFFKKGKNESSNLSKVAALLIHAAKIDENFSKNEEIIIKQNLLQMGANNKFGYKEYERNKDDTRDAKFIGMQ